LDLRERIVAAVEGGLSRRAAAKRFAVSESCAVKLIQRWTRTGSVAPATPWRRKPYALANHEKLVRDLMVAQPDMTLDELRAALAAAGIVVGRTSVHRYLEALDLTFKKRPSTPPSKAGRTSLRRGKPGTRARASSSLRI
jgi:putative transposase